MKKETIKILILTANPTETNPLSLGVEVRKIEEALARARNRDRFEVITRSAVRTIRWALAPCRPARPNSAATPIPNGAVL